MNRDINEYNDTLRLTKERQAAAEKEEDMRAAAFLAEKTKRERQTTEEAERQKKAKEREWARLRAQQEKVFPTTVEY